MNRDLADDRIFRAWFAAFLWLVMMFCLGLLAYASLDSATRSPTLWWFQFPVIGALIYWASRRSIVALLLLVAALLWEHWESLTEFRFFPTVTVLVVGYFLVQGLRTIWIERRAASDTDGVPNQRL